MDICNIISVGPPEFVDALPPRLPAARSAAGSPAIGRSDLLHSASRNLMLATVPKLRGFAVSLCGNRDRADDLVQETLVHALAALHSFQPGTSMTAWLFTILRNLFRSQVRKRWRDVEDSDGRYQASLISAPAQDSRLAFASFYAALAQLTADQREALILVGAAGFSYAEAATISGTAIGTIKSRVHRARLSLSVLLRPESRSFPDDDQPASPNSGRGPWGNGS